MVITNSVAAGHSSAVQRNRGCRSSTRWSSDVGSRRRARFAIYCGNGASDRMDACHRSVGFKSRELEADRRPIAIASRRHARTSRRRTRVTSAGSIRAPRRPS
jgi:hypothetical protein